jgi:hypothetical protein
MERNFGILGFLFLLTGSVLIYISKIYDDNKLALQITGALAFLIGTGIMIYYNKKGLR